MTSAAVETREVESGPSVRDRVIDVARHPAHISHEAQLLESLAADALEDGAHAVKRAMKSAKHGIEQLQDLKDEAAHRVKRQPVKALGIAVGVGLMLGMALGWIGGRFGRQRPTCN